MTRADRTSGRVEARGFSLVAAIFVLVVLSMLGAAMVTIGTAARWTAVGAAQGARAFQAAQAGIEWGVHQAINNTAATCSELPAAPTPITFPPASGLDGFTITVTCSFTSHREGNANYESFSIVSTAVTTGTSLGSPNYFSRTLSAAVTNAP